MTTTCPYICSNKTEFGYCKTTGCINPQYSSVSYTEVLTASAAMTQAEFEKYKKKVQTDEKK